MNLNTLLDTHTESDSANTEAEYLARWQATTGTVDSPFLKAIAGGLQADRMAWVFIAGYQAAIRHCFELPHTYRDQHWLTFAVSEDRSSDNPLPGVTWKETEGELTLNGHKTWIAACDSISALIVKAGRGEQARYGLVECDTPGLTLTSKAAPSMLPDLSQGRASFEQVAATRADLPQRRPVALFGATEAFMTYSAFAACIWAQTQARSGELAERSKLLLSQAESIFATEPESLRSESLKTFDQGIQSLLGDWLAQKRNAETHWQRDHRLVRMYSKGIQR